MFENLSKNVILKQVRETLLIAVFGGLLQGFLSRKGFLIGEDWGKDLFVFGFSASMWVALWKGNELMVFLIGEKYSWLDNPARRFVIGMVVMVIYTVVASFAVYYIFYGVIRGYNIFEQTGNRVNYFLISAIGITTIISLFAHGAAFLKSWRQSEINVEKLKKEKIASQYESLKSQVNPHFLFNSLNALSTLVYEDQAKAVEFIKELSKVYRYVLDVRTQDVVSLEDEMAFSQSYFFLQKIRFGENLRLILDLDSQCQNKSVPPLSIQLLLENAIKHNIVSEDDPLEISIVCKDAYIEVSNNLQPKTSKPEKDSNGMGLDNIVARYGHLSDRKVEISNGNGVFSVKMPLLTFSNY